MSLLEISDLRVSYPGGQAVLGGLNLDLRVGETLALSGPSGSGKTTVAYSILQVLPPHCTQSCSIRFLGMELMGQKEPVLRLIRGKDITAIPQQPAIALHPLIPVGRQIEDVLRAHSLYTAQSCRSVMEPMAKLGLGQECFHRYPHQLSSVQLQRAAIAQALTGEPKV